MFKKLLAYLTKFFAIAFVSYTFLAPQLLEAALSETLSSDHGTSNWRIKLHRETNLPLQPRAILSLCEDRGGYPWGWNPVALESCRLDLPTDASCNDTDPQGDGWGWNGSTSCRITLETQSHRCDNSGNYPWGWNPSTNTSCRMDLIDIPTTPTYPIPFYDLVSIPLECRKIEKQDNNGRNILENDNNIYYSTTLTTLDDRPLLNSYNQLSTNTYVDALYTLSNRNNSDFPSNLFAPVTVGISPRVFLFALNEDLTQSISFLRFEQLENGSFNLSERGVNSSTTSRCVVR